MHALTLLWGRARGEIERKLGRCSRCMRASLLGSLGTVGALLVLAAAGLPTLVVGATAAVAAAFCALVLAHAAAYVYHGTRPNAVVQTGPCCGQRSPAASSAPQRLLMLQRRPLVQVLFSLPTAFGAGQLAWVPRAAAQTTPTPPTPDFNGLATFRKRLDCSCGGECVFQAFFDYTATTANGKTKVTHFRMRWDQTASTGCAPSIDRGMGAFDFQCPDQDKPCRITGGNIWQCPCNTFVQFVPADGVPQEDCNCPNQKNRTAYAQGLCGAPFVVEKVCPDGFEWINIDFRHKVTCSCDGGRINRGDLVVVATFRDGVLDFGGDEV